METRAGDPGAFAQFDLNRVDSPAFVAGEAVRRPGRLLMQLALVAAAALMLAGCGDPQPDHEVPPPQTELSEERSVEKENTAVLDGFQRDEAQWPMRRGPLDGKMYPAPAMPEKEVARCKASGGKVTWRLGQFGHEQTCSRPYLPNRDAGTACSDSDECEGACIVRETAASTATNELTGFCSSGPQRNTCYTVLKDGKIATRICVD